MFDCTSGIGLPCSEIYPALLNAGLSTAATEMPKILDMLGTGLDWPSGPLCVPCMGGLFEDGCELEAAVLCGAPVLDTPEGALGCSGFAEPTG